jgi:hypothetical protein
VKGACLPSLPGCALFNPLCCPVLYLFLVPFWCQQPLLACWSVCWLQRPGRRGCCCCCCCVCVCAHVFRPLAGMASTWGGVCECCSGAPGGSTFCINRKRACMCMRLCTGLRALQAQLLQAVFKHACGHQQQLLQLPMGSSSGLWPFGWPVAPRCGAAAALYTPCAQCRPGGSYTHL